MNESKILLLNVLHAKLKIISKCNFWKLVLCRLSVENFIVFTPFKRCSGLCLNFASEAKVWFRALYSTTKQTCTHDPEKIWLACRVSKILIMRIDLVVQMARVKRITRYHKSTAIWSGDGSFFIRFVKRLLRGRSATSWPGRNLWVQTVDGCRRRLAAIPQFVFSSPQARQGE